MPTENERKYVLTDAEAVKALWPDEAWDDIRQGYLPGGPRIRRRAGQDTFTCKYAVAGRLIEIETVLEPRDFDDLWPLTERRIRKVRHTEIDAHGLQWDVDLLMDDTGVYFSMAECEMPEGMDAPPDILAVLAPFIRYAVPRARQSEFTNAKLADPAYAAGLSLG